MWGNFLQGQQRMLTRDLFAVANLPVNKLQYMLSGGIKLMSAGKN